MEVANIFAKITLNNDTVWDSNNLAKLWYSKTLCIHFYDEQWKIKPYKRLESEYIYNYTFTTTTAQGCLYQDYKTCWRHLSVEVDDSHDATDEQEYCPTYSHAHRPAYVVVI